MHHVRGQVELRSLLSIAYQAQGLTTAALDMLETAITLARPSSFIRTFVDLGPAMARLLFQLAEREFATDYLSDILAAFPDNLDAPAAGSETRPTTQANLVEPLSGRELEVLALLSDGLSNKRK